MPPTIKNYTSTVSAHQSQAKIEQCLVLAGASDISKSYSEGLCTAIRFRIEINGQAVFFQLPANIDACFKVLWAEVKRPKPETRKNTMDQAGRTAWKIVCDWVEAQLAMIQLEQAKPLQVFLPYVYDPGSDTTLYQRIEGNMKLLGAGTTN